MTDPSNPISTGYPFGQLIRALRSVATHDDPAIRARAEARADRWRTVLDGMASGQLTPGARTPVADTPVWATLEVVTGGFATGRLLAEQPLDDDERDLLQALPPPQPDDTDRGRINRHHLGAQGQQDLLVLLNGGRYRVELPEHGALMVVAWLSANDAVDAGLDIVEAIAPFLDRLRFTPVRTDRPQAIGATVHRWSVGQVQARLRARPPHARVATMNQTLQVWNPLTDQALALLLETVEGALPHVVTDADGAPQRHDNGQLRVEGGWPLVNRPADWDARATAWAVALLGAEAGDVRSGRPTNRRSSLARMRDGIAAALGQRAPLSPLERANLRSLLAGCIAKRGLPDSTRRRVLRQAQARDAARPMVSVLAGIVADRLEAVPADAGLPSVDPVAAPVTPAESSVHAGAHIPAPVRRQLHRCQEARVHDLVARGVLPSAEALAEVLPQLTSQVVAAGIQDQRLRGLFVQIYGAFRQRRGLLLLDLQHQVTIEELPWVAALADQRDTDLATAQVARQSLEQVGALALSSFPQTILPNPLVTELQALAKAAGLSIPLVEELAADIFTGSLTQKFQDAALIAADTLRGSLYARYYDLPTVQELEPGWPRGQRAIDASGGSRSGSAPGLKRMVERCRERKREARAGDSDRPRLTSGVAANGALLEQTQILHTHNLAALFALPGLSATLTSMLPTMARDCWSWIIADQRARPRTRYQQLRRLKNAAYAWRQMLFFLSVAPQGEQSAFLPWAWEQLEAAASNPRVERFRPVLVGLQAVADGQRFDSDGKLQDPQGRPGRRLLGWGVGGHWLEREVSEGG